MSNMLSVGLPDVRDSIADYAFDTLSGEVLQRWDTSLKEDNDAASLVLAINPALGNEAFKISTLDTSRTLLAGGDSRGLLYGIGKLLRTGGGDQSFDPMSCPRGLFAPQRSKRGIYFASHFHNFYHDAPIERVQQYTRELALWGCNMLCVWFDMHHFSGLDDPAARMMVERLHKILEAGQSAGLRPSLMLLANEAYSNSPVEMRADWTAGHDGYTHPPGGHYHVEICPSKPEGLDLILKWRKEVFEAFAGIDVANITIWPYDQGGCTCSRCAPWGVNGFLRTAEPIAHLAREFWPEVDVILSTWYFDHFIRGEWEGLAAEFNRHKPEWIDYILADDNGDTFPPFPLENGTPGGFGMISFPEISMYGGGPWGGYGANPLPEHLNHIWNKAGSKLLGGTPYSEGIYEDMNKAVMLQMFWSDHDPFKTIAEYASYEFGSATPERTIKLIRMLESAWTPHYVTMQDGDLDTVKFTTGNLDKAQEALSLAEDIEKDITPRARDAWRWRILKLRAGIDALIARDGGHPSDKLDAKFNELCAIYSAEEALPPVAPPSRKTLRRWYGRR